MHWIWGGRHLQLCWGDTWAVGINHNCVLHDRIRLGRWRCWGWGAVSIISPYFRGTRTRWTRTITFQCIQLRRWQAHGVRVCVLQELWITGWLHRLGHDRGTAIIHQVVLHVMCRVTVIPKTQLKQHCVSKLLVEIIMLNYIITRFIRGWTFCRLGLGIFIAAILSGHDWPKLRYIAENLRNDWVLRLHTLKVEHMVEKLFGGSWKYGWKETRDNILTKSNPDQFKAPCGETHHAALRCKWWNSWWNLHHTKSGQHRDPCSASSEVCQPAGA